MSDNTEVMKKLKYFFTFHRNTASALQQHTLYERTMATTTQHTPTDTDNTSFGIGRMSDEEYEGEFSNGGGGESSTPRPGTSDNAAATRTASRAIWSFSQAAKASAVEIKRKRSPKSRTDYRMAANVVIQRAFSVLEKRLCEQRNSESPPPNVMSEAGFSLLKQAIENFRVRIVVHDSMTREELKQAQVKCVEDLAKFTETVKEFGLIPPSFTERNATFIQTCLAKKEDLIHLNAAISAEIRRMTQQNERVPSQHAEIARSSGITLQNVLSAQTIRRRFLSLNALTRAIREDLQAFLTQDHRSDDRATVVQQIKDSCMAAKKKH
jgi:hypothetical protein